MDEKTSIKVNVHSVVEEPHTYIIAPCSDSIADRLAYNDTRMEDIREFSETIIDSDGNHITDVLRGLTGDKPEQQAECGQSKGGHYPCTGCSAKASMFDDLAHCFRLPFRSFDDRIRKVIFLERNIIQFENKPAEWNKQNIQSSPITRNRKGNNAPVELAGVELAG